MKKYTILVPVLLLLALSGCKLEQTTRLKQSQLLGEAKSIEAIAKIEVAACVDSDDRTKPSNSLIKANNLMNDLFPDSQFDGCEREDMDSFATYTIPVEVGVLPSEGSGYKLKGVSIFRNENGIVFYALSKEVRDSITNAKKDSKNLSLKVNIRFTNDTDKSLKIIPHSTFANGKPFAGFISMDDNILVKPREAINFTISNVSSEYAIATGWVPIFKEEL